MASKWRKVTDLTYPRVSFFTGSEFNDVVKQTIGEFNLIEDTWISYFNITTNITHQKMMVHR